MTETNPPLSIQIGPIQVEVAQTLGYYGGIAAAVALGALEPPLAIFIAAIPILKTLNNPAAPQPLRFLGQFLQGAGKPVGSDGEGTIRLADPKQAWADMKRLVAAPTGRNTAPA